MMLDYIFYDYAVEQLNGEYGGAHSRVYPWQVVQPGHTPAAAIGWLLFGFGDYQASGTTTVILAMTATFRPRFSIASRTTAIRPYVDIALKRTRWRMRHSGPAAFEVEGKSTTPVYKYTYMDPISCSVPARAACCSRSSRRPGASSGAKTAPRPRTRSSALQPYSSGYEGTMYFGSRWDTPSNLIARSKADYDSPDKFEGGSPYEQVAQHGPALIALYDMPPAPLSAHRHLFLAGPGAPRRGPVRLDFLPGRTRSISAIGPLPRANGSRWAGPGC
jgi:hypothetical protein